MSLIKLMRGALAPIKLFRKQVITFVSIRRYDLGIMYENLSYIATRPSASVFVLRQKVWHLLDLPDYCQEVIILKSPDNVEVPLTELRKGNHPYNPYILEVWLPENRNSVSSIVLNNMLMDKKIRSQTQCLSTTTTDINGLDKSAECSCASQITISNEKTKKSHSAINNLLCADTKNSEISCRLSTCSIIRLNGKKSNNFSDILIKIQNDLCHLSSKIDILENKITN